MIARTIYSVNALVDALRNLLEASYPVVWVEGEISGLAKPASGHLYFSLKEGNAVIRCVFFRNRSANAIVLEEGMQVLIRAQISVYKNRGDLQLIVNQLELAGEGALRQAFEHLKAKLLAAGLFDAIHKKPLPDYPDSIGIITSSTAAAVDDIVTTLKRRYPIAHVIVYPTLVQGELAPNSICEMIEVASKRNEVKVLIVARGGGSLEDLQAFNDERVARAIFECPIPIISGVGHEVDFTIADMVADQRAATPTAAAELVAPLAQHIRRNLAQVVAQMQRNIQRMSDQLRQQVDIASAKLVHPAQRLQNYQARLQHQQSLIVWSADNTLQTARRSYAQCNHKLLQLSPDLQLTTARQSVNQAGQQIVRHTTFRLAQIGWQLQHKQNSLQLINPMNTLDRGYAILLDENKSVVQSSKKVTAGQILTATVADGNIAMAVTRTDHANTATTPTK